MFELGCENCGRRLGALAYTAEPRDLLDDELEFAVN